MLVSPPPLPRTHKLHSFPFFPVPPTQAICQVTSHYRSFFWAQRGKMKTPDAPSVTRQYLNLDHSTQLQISVIQPFSKAPALL